MRNLRFLLAAVILSACGGGDSTGPNPEASAVGNYALQQVNGTTPPVTIFSNAAGRIEITGGTLALRSDRSYTETIQVRVVYTDGTPSENSSGIENGNYSVTGSQVTFTIPASAGDPAFSYTGAVSNNVVTYTYEGTSYRYSK